VPMAPVLFIFPTKSILLPRSAYRTLKMEVAGSSETSATIYKTAQHHVLEDSSFYTTCCKNLKCSVTCGIYRMFCTRDIGCTPSSAWHTCSLLLVIFSHFPLGQTTGIYDDYVPTNVPLYA
jgi:hypothetical protein